MKLHWKSGPLWAFLGGVALLAVHTPGIIPDEWRPSALLILSLLGFTGSAVAEPHRHPEAKTRRSDTETRNRRKSDRANPPD